MKCSAETTRDCRTSAKRMNTCPLGSGALAGTTYPLDREYTAELLGFDGPTLNSMDGVSDRDYLVGTVICTQHYDDAPEQIL